MPAKFYQERINRTQVIFGQIYKHTYKRRLVPLGFENFASLGQ